MYFFDSHFHVQNLTHPNIENFIDRLRNESRIARLLTEEISESFINNAINIAAFSAPLILPLLGVLGPVAGLVRLINRVFDRDEDAKPTMAHLYIINLLLLMNRPIDVYLEEVNQDVLELIKKEALKIGNQSFDKVAVSALIMDYTDRDYTQSEAIANFQYARVGKPVVRQTEDLLAGMKRFNENQGDNVKLTVMPFLGMNPENYGFVDDQPKKVKLPIHLNLNLLPDEWVGGTSMKLLYTPSTKLLVWTPDSMSADEYEKLTEALQTDGASEDIVRQAKALLTDLQLSVGGERSVNQVYITRKFDIPESLSKKCNTVDAEGGGVNLNWTHPSMTEVDRKALQNAIPKPNEHSDAKDRAERAYNLGRIEFLFKQLDAQHNSETPTLNELLDKYFGDAPPSMQTLENNQTAWTGKMDDVGRGVFLGVKLYPPLGFDPYPDGTPDINPRKARVLYLYSFCAQRGIPLTVHTSSGGFQLMSKERHKLYTSPERWLPVMDRFPNLRINFAHCGIQNADMDSDHEWKKVLFERIICKAVKPHGMSSAEWASLLDNPNTDPSEIAWSNPNAYADLSDLLNTKEAYKQFSRGMRALDLTEVQWKHLRSRLLFGSDFMINLRECASYVDYISQYTKNKYGVWADVNGDKLKFDDDEFRFQMAHTNPMRFHFGGI
ncbi:MAG: amidohydrolase family protein [Flavobacteriia bacterium]|nr:amidohydrolase family protein [Flavobacteriia bacterium]